jgi:hypothetical protein
MNLFPYKCPNGVAKAANDAKANRSGKINHYASTACPKIQFFQILLLPFGLSFVHHKGLFSF